MAKDLANKQFMKDFDELPEGEQQKLIEKLQKKQKKEPEKPKTSSREGRKKKSTDGAWE